MKNGKVMLTPLLVAVLLISAFSCSSRDADNTDGGTQCGLGGFKCDNNKAYNCGTDGKWIVTDCSALLGMECVAENTGAKCKPITAPDAGVTDGGNPDAGAQCGLGGFKCDNNRAYNCGPDNKWIITDCSALLGVECVADNTGAKCKPITAPDGGVADGSTPDGGSKDGGPAATFTALPFSNETVLKCGVNGMSRDGHTLAGACVGTDNEFEAVIWVDGVLTNLGHMGKPVPSMSQNTYAYGSSNGGIVIGNEGYENLSPTAYYYKDSKWTQIVNPVTKFFPAMEANGISADGEIIVGNTKDKIDNQGTEEDFQGGYSLDATTGDYTLATSSYFADVCDSYTKCAIYFNAVSADGTAVVGYDTYSADGVSITAESPVYYLLSGEAPPIRLPIPDNYPVGIAKGMSSDGSTIVGGVSGNLMPTLAVYWDSNMAVHCIGSLGPDTEYNDTMAYSVTDSGEVIVGISNMQAFIFFTRAGVILPLADYLSTLGLGDVLKDWELLSAVAVSADGHRIAGTGVYQNLHLRGYLVYIP